MRGASLDPFLAFILLFNQTMKGKDVFNEYRSAPRAISIGLIVFVFHIIGCASTPPIHDAIIKGDIKTFNKLIAQDQNINVKDRRGNLPIHVATSKRQKDIINVLLKLGADINAKGRWGWTPLMYASSNGYLEIAKLLIANGAEINERANANYTPIYLAAANGKVSIIKLLIHENADVNVVDNVGMTPLMVALNKCWLEAAEVLIENGAHIDTRNNTGSTTLMISSEIRCKKHLEKERLEIVKMLIEKGADIKVKNNYRSTALFYAAKSGHSGIVSLLIDRGAEIEAKNKLGGTPLMVASENGHKEIVKLLVERGADVNAKNIYGKSIMYITVFNEYLGEINHVYNGKHKQVAEYLIGAGARIIIYDHDKSVEKTVFSTTEEFYVTAISFRAAAHYYWKKGNDAETEQNYKQAKKYFKKAIPKAIKGSMLVGVFKATSGAGKEHNALGAKVSVALNNSKRYLKECDEVLNCFQKTKGTVALTQCVMSIPNTSLAGR